MRPFDYHNPTRVLVGAGKTAAIEQLVPADARTLVVFGGGSARSNGVADEVRQALAGRDMREHWGVTPNPTLSDVEAILRVIKEARIDFLLAVGGGSVIDATKFAAAAARADVDPATVLVRNTRVADPIPVGVVLTLCGTGSESNGTAAISNQVTAQKLVYLNPAIHPVFAIADPDHLQHLPQHLLANGVVDAFVHVLEQYVTYSVGAVLQERLAEAILTTLLEIADAVVSGESDYDTRANFVWAASLAQNGLLATGVPEDWATHFIGHELTAHFGVAHARSLTLVLPAVYDLRFVKKQERLAQLGSRVFGIAAGPEPEVARETILRLVAFFERLGLSTDLRSLNLTAEHVQKIVAGLKSARRVRLGERLDISLKEVEAMLLQAAGISSASD